ncbi:MAG: GGDEF domain-containing protein [Thermotogaceae bacterium]|nr:GGDEF domain-containing protein [Thermotogaceae bacterium]
MCENLMRELVKGKYIDPVTRLPDKEFYEKFLNDIKDEESLKIIEVHIEFKNIDFETKDIVISRIASMIKHSVRVPKDIVIRTGDTDFIVIIGNIDDKLASMVANRIKDNLLYFNLNVSGKVIEITPTVKVKNTQRGNYYL